MNIAEVMRHLLFEFFALTTEGEIWHAWFTGQGKLDTGVSNYQMKVERIFAYGRMLEEPFLALNNGIFLAVTAQGLAKFNLNEKFFWKVAHGSSLTIPDADQTSQWGDKTKPLAGLFLEREVALRAAAEQRLVVKDNRFAKETENVLVAINGNHPLFALPEDEQKLKFYFGTHPKITWPEKRIMLLESTEPPDKDAAAVLEEVRKRKRSSSPLVQEVRAEEQQAAKKRTGCSRGRPQGSLNKPRPTKVFAPVTAEMKKLIQQTLIKVDSELAQRPKEEKPGSHIQVVDNEKRIILSTRVAHTCTELKSQAKKVFGPDIYPLLEVVYHNVHCYVHKEPYLEQGVAYGQPISVWKKIAKESDGTIQLECT